MKSPPDLSRFKSKRTSCPTWGEPDATAASKRKEVFRQRAENLARAMKRPDVRGVSRRFLVVMVGSQRVGLPLKGIQRVFSDPRTIHVPLGPPWLVGVANCEGQIRPIADLATMLGYTDVPVASHRYVVLARTRTIPLGLRVNGVVEIRAIEETSIAAPTATDDAPESPFLEGVTPDAVAIVDLPALLDHVTTRVTAAPTHWRTEDVLGGGEPLP